MYCDAGGQVGDQDEMLGRGGNLDGKNLLLLAVWSTCARATGLVGDQSTQLVCARNAWLILVTRDARQRPRGALLLLQWGCPARTVGREDH